jgi:hypothetical protein
MGKTFSFHQRGKRALQKACTMKSILLALCLHTSLLSMAQSLAEPLNAAPARLWAPAPTFSNAFCFGTNPAMLGPNKKIMLAAAGEQRFGLAELGSYALNAVLPVKGSAFGLGIGGGGAAVWRVGSLAAGYGMELGTLAAAGIGFRYRREGGGGLSANSFAADAGFLLQLATGVRLGASLHRPVRARGTKDMQPGDAARYAMSLTWEAPAQWLLAAEISQNEGRRPALAAGFAYAFSKSMQVQAGIDTGISSFFFSVGLPLAGFTVQPSVVLHRELGLTPGLLLFYPAK